MDWNGDVSVFILAGGKSMRMGIDKAFAQLGGRTLLARMLDAARSLTSNVYIVGSRRYFPRVWAAQRDPRSAPLLVHGPERRACG